MVRRVKGGAMERCLTILQYCARLFGRLNLRSLNSTTCLPAGRPRSSEGFGQQLPQSAVKEIKVKTVTKIVIPVIAYAAVIVAVMFGLFCWVHTGSTELKDGVPVSASAMDWSSVSVVSYRTYSQIDAVSIYKFIGDDTTYWYTKDGNLHSITISGGITNRTYNDISNPTQLAVYEPKAKALRERVIKEFSTVMPPR